MYDYLEVARLQNSFRFGDVHDENEEKQIDVVEEVAPPTEEVYTKAELLIENLILVGIGWSDDPAVMISNLDSGKMYFLKRGQRIDGMIKVEAIFEGRVILTYDNGKEKELR